MKESHERIKDPASLPPVTPEASLFRLIRDNPLQATALATVAVLFLCWFYPRQPDAPPPTPAHASSSDFWKDDEIVWPPKPPVEVNTSLHVTLGGDQGEWKPSGDGKTIVNTRTGEIRTTLTGEEVSEFNERQNDNLLSLSRYLAEQKKKSDAEEARKAQEYEQQRRYEEAEWARQVAANVAERRRVSKAWAPIRTGMTQNQVSGYIGQPRFEWSHKWVYTYQILIDGAPGYSVADEGIILFDSDGYVTSFQKPVTPN